MTFRSPGVVVARTLLVRYATLRVFSDGQKGESSDQRRVLAGARSAGLIPRAADKQRDRFGASHRPNWPLVPQTATDRRTQSPVGVSNSVRRRTPPFAARFF